MYVSLENPNIYIHEQIHLKSKFSLADSVYDDIISFIILSSVWYWQIRYWCFIRISYEAQTLWNYRHFDFVSLTLTKTSIVYIANDKKFCRNLRVTCSIFNENYKYISRLIFIYYTCKRTGRAAIAILVDPCEMNFTSFCSNNSGLNSVKRKKNRVHMKIKCKKKKNSGKNLLETSNFTLCNVSNTSSLLFFSPK